LFLAIMRGVSNWSIHRASSGVRGFDSLFGRLRLSVTRLRPGYTKSLKIVTSFLAGYV
jgi:hypothetical protein